MNLRQKLYDHLQGDVNLPTSTTNLYYSFLQKMKQDTKILDIGVGTGIYFEDHRCIKLIKEKNIKIVGIDINKPDIELASQRIIESDLGMNVEAKYVDLFEYDGNLNEFDVILFCESYPIIPEELMVKMLNHILHVKGFKGTLSFINNLEDDPTWVQAIKPFLKHILFGAEMFGRLVSRNDMEKVFIQAGLNKGNITYELLAASTINYALFRDKIKFPFWNFPMKQYLIMYFKINT